VASRRTLPLLAATLALAACGPPARPRDDVYSFEDTKACLEDAGARISTKPELLGPLTEAAPGGGMYVFLEDGTTLTIAFGNTKAEAQRIADGFRQVPRTSRERKRLKSLLQPEGNAVLLWIVEPKPAEVELVRNCLR
jgi:hypothetical protein